MIRPTVARIDLAALKSNYRHIVDYLAADGAVRTPGVIAVEGRSTWPVASFPEIRALLDERQRQGYRVAFEQDGWIVLRRAR